jgi:phosphoribosyl 1,2-cyclic phosphodiesterase
LKINQVVHDAASGTAAVYASSNADTPFADEKWAMDYAVFLSFSEDGSKIDKMGEMLDTSAFKHLFPKLQQYFMEQAKRDHA